MSGHIPRPIASIPLVATLLVFGVGISVPANIARADHCLSAPNSLAPQGTHWYYQLDWATQRKCWYMRPFRRPGQRAAASATLAGVTPVHSMPPPSGPVPADDGAPMSKPAEMITATRDTLAQRSAQEGNTAPSLIEAPAPQLSTSPQTNAQAAAPPAPVASPAPAPATVKAQESIAIPTRCPLGLSVRRCREDWPARRADQKRWDHNIPYSGARPGGCRYFVSRCYENCCCASP